MLLSILALILDAEENTTTERLSKKMENITKKYAKGKSNVTLLKVKSYVPL